MGDIREFLIRSSHKVIGHYQFLLETATSNAERQRYRSRIEEETRLLDALTVEAKQAA
ncbi:hypothetical protein JQ615_38670 [Bradyrhizobium jicamae]|uniref:Uncharacterized protein n=1 Tax=Bradyrhizobium jicamae TaxID=280332 RepID=A0ABS5FWW5_9BRAD|nr:hypothetical protein [Bradyrhizobium jicamae]MBR0801287.1 hypothetical protein [Bradyrhizobium jicamae]